MGTQDLKVATRMGFGIALLGLLQILVAAVGIWNADTQYRGAREVIDRDLGLAARTSSLREGMLGLRRVEKDLLIYIGNMEKAREYRVEWDERIRATYGALNEASKLASSQGEVDLVKRIGEALAQYHGGREMVFAGMAAGGIKTAVDADAALDMFKESMQSMEVLTVELAVGADRRAAAALVGLEAKRSRDLLVAVAMTLFALMLAAVIAHLLIRSIMRPLKEAAAVAAVATAAAESLEEQAKQLASAVTAFRMGGVVPTDLVREVIRRAQQGARNAVHPDHGQHTGAQVLPAPGTSGRNRPIGR